MANVKAVLIVDDRRTVLSFLERLLSARGYNVLTATSAEDALQRLDTGTAKVDLLVTDYSMPGEANGIELIQSARKRGLTIPAILNTGEPDASLEYQLSILKGNNTMFDKLKLGNGEGFLRLVEEKLALSPQQER